MNNVDDIKFDVRLCFGHIVLLTLPDRIAEDGWHVCRGRIMAFDGDGVKTRDEVFETGARWRA